MRPAVPWPVPEFRGQAVGVPQSSRWPGCSAGLLPHFEPTNPEENGIAQWQALRLIAALRPGFPRLCNSTG